MKTGQPYILTLLHYFTYNHLLSNWWFHAPGLLTCELSCWSNGVGSNTHTFLP